MTAPASVPPPVVAERNEDRAWLDLALALRVVTPDAPGPAGIDYERAANRVQCSPTSPDEMMLSLARAARGARAVDRVAERLAELRGLGLDARGRRSLAVLVRLREAPASLEWIAVSVSALSTPDAVTRARVALLDALADDAGLSTPEERAAWAASMKPNGARRQWARLALREAWALWYGRAW